MSFEDGRRAALDLLDQVDLPAPFDVGELCARLAQVRGRAIDLAPLGSDSEASGWYFDLEDRDLICFSQATSAYHQQVIVLHEVGHLVMDHYGIDSEEPIPPVLLKDFSPDTLRRLRHRHGYTSGEEQAAEGFATTVLDAADQAAQAGLGSAGATSQAERRRLASMFVA